MSERSPTVFVADDNPILLQGLERALHSDGYTVHTADTGPALLQMLEQAPIPPDLLLLDVMMPGMSGIDVLRELHANPRWTDLPVILITAATDEQLPVSALQHGAVDFLTKPFRLGELLARVETHVSRYRDLRRAQTEAEARMQVIDIVRDLNSVVTADEMFRLVTGRVSEICGGARCQVLIDEGDGRVRIAASSEASDAVGELLAPDEYAALRLVLESEAPALVEDAATSTLFRLGAGVEIRSAVAVPLPITEQTRGVLFLRAGEGEPALGMEALEIAQQVTDGMAQALGRAQVFETLIEQGRHLHDLAHTDELTGCASRRAVMRYLSEELDLARRRNSPLSIVMLDLDHFKEINDTYGHLAGDAVLRTFGEWLQGEGGHRIKDCIGRIGGDEFFAVLPDTEAEGALRFAERARDYLASVTFVFGDVPTRASLSAGIAAWPDAGTIEVEALIEQADAALYRAKQAGRDAICVAPPAPTDPDDDASGE